MEKGKWKHSNLFKISLIIICIVTLSFCINGVSAADTSNIYVNTHGNDGWDGLSSTYNTSTGSGPKATINNAKDTVSTSGTVHIANGTYYEHGININSNMTIIGENQKNTIIDAQNNQIFTNNENINLTLINLTLKNGYAVHGGAIMNYGTLTLINCTLYNNTAVFDGAIYNYVGGLLNVESCTFNKNNATYDSGAIYNDRGSTLFVNNTKFIENIAGTDGGVISNFGTATITNSILTKNRADSNNNIDPEFQQLLDGPHHFSANGGCINNMATLTVNNCSFTGNSATDNGGVIFNYGIATISNSTFTGNNATSGGAICNFGTTNISNTSFTGNNAASNGGAIYNNNLLTCDNSTFLNNLASYNGGAIYTSDDCTVTGSIFANNTAYTIFNEAGNSEVHFNRIIGYIHQLDLYASSGSINADNNWWNTNFSGTNPVNDGRVYGNVNVNNWVILSVNSSPKTINNGGKSTITADLNHINGNDGILPLVGGHIPDGPVTLNIPWGSFNTPQVSHLITQDTVNGIMNATFYANDGAINPLYNPVEVTATADGYTTNADESAYIKINKTSNLYLQITSNNNNPKTNETVTVTYKIGNHGPDLADNITVNIPLPEGFTLNTIKGDGTWNVVNNTIIWTLETVPVGDPYLYITGKFPETGNYSFGSSFSADTLIIKVEDEPVNPNQPAKPEVKAAHESIPMQNTGIPLAPLALAFISIVGGLTAVRRK